MPAVPRSVPPKYSLHKASRRAYVSYRGDRRYLGPYESPESKEAYQRFLIEWAADRAKAALPPAPPAEDEQPFTVLELCWAYFQYAKGYYRKHGQPTRSLDNLKLAIRPLRDAYGREPAATFSPRYLLALQTTLASKGLTRAYVNKQIGAIKRMFKWGMTRELVPAAVFTALSGVEGLRLGRSAARESTPVLPVEDSVVEATLPYLTPVLQAMVRFQRLTGARPAEVCMIRPCDVDRSGEVWRYVPHVHKMEHKGRQRTVYVGPQAQDVLRPFLLREATANCFQPAESERRRHQEQRSRRQTKVQPSQWDRRKAAPKRPPSTSYGRASYATAIRRAVEKANTRRRKIAEQTGVQEPELLPHWHPNQLRHSKATEIRREFGQRGLEAAQVTLGHKKADVTQVYAERDAALAVEVARRIG